MGSQGAASVGAGSVAGASVGAVGGGGSANGGARGASQSGSQSGTVGRRSTQRSVGGRSGGGYGNASPKKSPSKPAAARAGEGRGNRMGIEEHAARRAEKMNEMRRKEKSTFLEDDGFVVPEWQPTSKHAMAIRGMRPDTTPFGRNPKLYKFRDAPPSSKG